MKYTNNHLCKWILQKKKKKKKKKKIFFTDVWIFLMFFPITSISHKNAIHTNNLDKFLDKSISLSLMYSLTGFHGFIAIIMSIFQWNQPKMQMSTAFYGGVSMATIRSSSEELYLSVIQWYSSANCIYTCQIPLLFLEYFLL